MKTAMMKKQASKLFSDTLVKTQRLNEDVDFGMMMKG
jgi:hypothetical protein